MNGRRVGTFSLGFILLGFGIVFLLGSFGLKLDYLFILSLWPIILIFLGLEILIFYFSNKQAQIRYDGGAIFLLIITTIFTFLLAGAQFVLSNHLYNWIY